VELSAKKKIISFNWWTSYCLETMVQQVMGTKWAKKLRHSIKPLYPTGKEVPVLSDEPY